MPDHRLVVSLRQDRPIPLDVEFSCDPGHVLAIFGRFIVTYNSYVTVRNYNTLLIIYNRFLPGILVEIRCIQIPLSKMTLTNRINGSWPIF